MALRANALPLYGNKLGFHREDSTVILACLEGDIQLRFI